MKPVGGTSPERPTDERLWDVFVARGTGLLAGSRCWWPTMPCGSQSHSADVVLLLGPFHHLLDRADRLAALTETRRVVRPAGLVVAAAAAISRYAGLLDFAALGLLDGQTEPLLREVIRTGRHDPLLGFTAVYFHTPEELAGELRAAGFCAVDVFGVEGPTGPALDTHGLDRVDDLLPAAISCARVVECDPALIAASAHLLAVTRG